MNGKQAEFGSVRLPVLACNREDSRHRGFDERSEFFRVNLAGDDDFVAREVFRLFHLQLRARRRPQLPFEGEALDHLVPYPLVKLSADLAAPTVSLIKAEVHHHAMTILLLGDDGHQAVAVRLVRGGIRQENLSRWTRP